MILVSLGKIGDICNILPLLQHDSLNGSHLRLMVSKHYAPLLEGVSYVQPIVFDGEAHELKRAVEEAKALGDEVRCIQVAGPAEMVRDYSFAPTGTPHATTDNFSKEAWKLAGAVNLWNEQPPLVFDKRDAVRETELRSRVFGKHRKPPILIALGGETAPFPYPKLLKELVTLRFSKERKVIDVSDVRAERFYDLVGLYEQAHCLISSDTATLHLARATPRLPIVALVNDKPGYWHGSPWRANHLFHCRYGDFLGRFAEMLKVIELVDSICVRESPAIIHVWNSTERSEWEIPESDRWAQCPMPSGSLRDSKTALKDQARQPFLKDMLRAAYWRSRTSDIICITRPDIEFNEGITDKIISNNPCWAHRSTPDGENFQFHPAADLFAFSKAFYVEHRKELPDMVCGTDQSWSRVMVALLKKHGGKELPFAVWRESKPKTGNRSISAGYNDKLEREWLKENQIILEPPQVIDQVAGIRLNPHALSPFGYNGSIIEWNGRRLMAYRWHREGLSTVLAMAELDENYNITNNKGIVGDTKSLEDPRMFILAGELCISYVQSDWPKNPTCVTKYGILQESGNEWKIVHGIQPKHGLNDGTALEKNFVPFVYNAKLHYIYTSSPQQSVIEMDGENVVNVHHSDMPYWAWGQVKGGVIAPSLYKGKMLRFFHSRLDNHPSPHPWRYYVGASLMEPEPPFHTVAISREPIVQASGLDSYTEDDRRKCRHYKTKVVFPSGVIEAGDEWHLSAGVNDSAVAILKLKEGDFKL